MSGHSVSAKANRWPIYLSIVVLRIGFTSRHRLSDKKIYALCGILVEASGATPLYVMPG